MIEDRDFVSFEMGGQVRKGRVLAISGERASVKIAGGNPSEAWLPIKSLTYLPKKG